jgi:Uma2 family endonuclease
MTIATQRPTIDDLLRLGSDARIEVVEGEIIEMAPVGGLHNWIAKNIAWMLEEYVKTHKLGLVFTDALLYILATDEESSIRRARVPDASFIRKAEILADWDFERPYPGAPTLAVEVMSPDDQIEDVIAKVQEYLDSGTSEVWVVLPRQKTVYRYFRGESQVQTYRDDDTIDVSILFPDLTLADIFALPDLD